ncbi:hypothetical protein ABH922_002222 [Rhodococcus sp. 27YEA15]|uniref:hypothetical protein n=1 Tax=Rhodococcus sp. 27YEA15 TaxID=3156259 RepID=UPI003C7A7125
MNHANLGPVRAFTPIVARTRAIHRPIEPVAYDCVKLIFVRAGSAILLSEFGEKSIRFGDVVALAANTHCGSKPEGSITVSTLYLDRDYVIDQVFWQHPALLTDRWDAQDFAGCGSRRAGCWWAYSGAGSTGR